MDEFTLRKKMQKRGLSIIEGDIETKIFAIKNVLKMTLGNKKQVDRYFHRNFLKWLREKIEKKPSYEREMLRKIVDFSIEASGPSVRNSNALFMSIIKKELQYPK